MKLTDIKGERAIDVLVEIITPIGNIAADESAADLFRRRPLPHGMSVRAFAMQRISAGLPALLKTHKADFVKILAAIRGEDETEVIENMTLISLINDVTDMMTDDLLRTFFGFAQIGQTSSESVLRNTEGEAERNESSDI